MVQIPTEDMYVRILSKRTGKVLIDDKDVSGGLSHQVKDTIKGEQWWRVIPVSGQDKKYMIKNVSTGRVMWCREKSRTAGCIEGDGKYPDNWFIFDETDLPGCKDTFRLKCPATNSVVFSRDHKKPEVDGFTLNKDGSPDYEDHHFSFLFDDVEVISVTYDTKNATSIDGEGKPLIIYGPRDFFNRGSVEQSQTFSYNQEKSDEESFEHKHGFNLTIGTKFKIDSFPVVKVGGEIDVTFSQTNEITWGQKQSKVEKWGLSETIKIPPRTKCTATFEGRHMNIDVPFEMVWRSKTTNREMTTYGVYKAVKNYHSNTTVDEKKLTEEELQEPINGRKENRELYSEDAEEGGSVSGQNYYVEGTYEDESRNGEYEAQEVEESNDGGLDREHQNDEPQWETDQDDRSYEGNGVADNGEEQRQDGANESRHGENGASDNEDGAYNAYDHEDNAGQYYDDQNAYENSEQQNTCSEYNEEEILDASYNQEDSNAVGPEQCDPYESGPYGKTEEEDSEERSYEPTYSTDHDKCKRNSERNGANTQYLPQTDTDPKGNNDTPADSGRNEYGEPTAEADVYDHGYGNRASEWEGEGNDRGDNSEQSIYPSSGYVREQNYNQARQYEEGSTEEYEGAGVPYRVAYRQYGGGYE